MATAVERPLSSFVDASSSHRTRHPDPPEIIDVDLLDDDDVQIIVGRQRSPHIAGPSRLSEASRPNRVDETIFLLDDSDDNETPSTTSARHLERRRLFSPPPPRRNAPFVMVPPVPPVPSQYLGHTSMVHRQHPRAVPPPPVQPLDRSFAFDFARSSSPVAGPSGQQAQQASSSGSQRAPSASARSHHVPTLGLGGALIANNRARVAHERRLTREMPGRADSFYGQAFRRIYSGVFSPFDHLFSGDVTQLADDEDHGLADFLRQRDRFRPPLTEKDHYKPFYTHPIAAEPGFTHDFAPESSSPEAATFPSSSKSDPIVITDEQDESNPQEEVKINTLLVCARCQDPLLLNSGLTGSASAQHKIWALRCGHLIDSKCLSEIGQPQVVGDRKGKGKAKEEVPYGEDFLLRNQSMDILEPAPVPEPSICSRLRSHAHPAAQDELFAGVFPPLPDSRKRKRGLTKASPNKKEKVEEEYDWPCPVPGCGRLHTSVKVGGVWGPEKEVNVGGRKGPGWKLRSGPEASSRGVIPVFA